MAERSLEERGLNPERCNYLRTLERSECSEALQYRPTFPGRFGAIQHARSHSEVFFNWYNMEHRHSGIGLLTPFDVHYGLAEERRNQRAAVLRAADDATPERFVRQLPVPPALPTAAWINPPKLLMTSTISEDVAQ